MLETERLYLKLLNEKDELDIVEWRNQRRIIDNLFSYKGPTLQEHRRWYEEYTRSDKRVEFIIVKKVDNKKIGSIGLSNIDYKNQKAEYGIIIGAQDETGKGYAKEATVAIIDYGFYELNLQKIFLKVFEDNKEAVNLYKKSCFVQEGILRNEIFKNGKYKNVLVMSILRDEWKNENV